MNAGTDFHSDYQNWSSSELAFNGFGSSDLSTPGGSDLDSTEVESEDDGFMANLTCRMSDYMLEDEHEDCPSIKNSRWGNQRNKTRRGGRDKSELTQWFSPSEHLLQPGGSAMKAVYLGSGESRRTSTGTGVFLPRVSNPVAFQPAAGKKTRKCSTVLIPARVLRLLEQHFNNVDGSNGAINSNGGPTVIVGPDDVYKQTRQQTRPTINYDDEIQLPQEWTY